MRGHRKIPANEIADRLAKQGSEWPFIGSEPTLGMIKTTVWDCLSSMDANPAKDAMAASTKIQTKQTDAKRSFGRKTINWQSTKS